MSVNKFPILIRTIEDIQEGKKGLRILREELQAPATGFNRQIVNWLQNKKYPLRKGTIPESTERLDPSYQQTPTERLHPGSLPLYKAQRYRIRKQRGVMNLSVIFENLGVHAAYFFNEMRPHVISPKPDHERLKFWSGSPLPWMPPNVRKWPKVPGTFFPALVEHPGHMNYARLVQELFRVGYKGQFTKAMSRAARRIGIDSIRKAIG